MPTACPKCPYIDKKERVKTTRPFVLALFSKTQRFDDGSISFDIFCFKIVEKTTTLTNHLQKTATGMVILLVHFKMFVEVVDSLRKNRTLPDSRYSYFSIFFFNCKSKTRPFFVFI